MHTRSTHLFWCAVVLSTLLPEAFENTLQNRAAAAPAPRESQKAKPDMQASTFAFDVKADRMPTGYKGHDIQALFKTLTAKRLSVLTGKMVAPSQLSEQMLRDMAYTRPEQFKGEFETTQAFNDRVTAGYKKLAQEIAPQSPFTLVRNLGQEQVEAKRLAELKAEDGSSRPILRTPDLKAEYNADAGILQVELTLRIVPSPGPFGDYATRSSQAWVSAGRDQVQYVKRSVQVTAYDLIVTNKRQFDTTVRVPGQPQSDEASCTVRAKMTPATAQRVKPHLAVLFIFDVPEPYTNTANIIQNNYGLFVDAEIHGRFIYANLRQIWLYDSQTGEVFEKVLPKA